MDDVMTTTSPLLTPDQVADMLGITTKTLQKWRLDGGGPPAVFLTARTVRYRQADVDSWIESHPPAYKYESEKPE